MNKKIQFVVSQAIIASLYVVLTVIVTPFSYMAIQLRISEIMVLLCFYKKDYIVQTILYGTLPVHYLGQCLPHIPSPVEYNYVVHHPA